jgi:predicted GNAT superfamily acetyltransferase
MVAARIGWTPEQWGRLTRAQRTLLARAIEDRDAEMAETMRDAISNALANALLKRGARPIDLYRDVSSSHNAMGHAEAIGKMRAIEDMMRR